MGIPTGRSDSTLQDDPGVSAPGGTEGASGTEEARERPGWQGWIPCRVFEDKDQDFTGGDGDQETAVTNPDVREQDPAALYEVREAAA